MTDNFECINAPRVEKMLKMLDTIEKSAKSNRAQDQLPRVLTPLRSRLSGGPAPVATSLPDALPDAPVVSRQGQANTKPYRKGSFAEMIDGMDAQRLANLISFAAIRLDTMLMESDQ